MLTAPLRDRFGVVHRLEFYTVEELLTIVRRSAQVFQVEIDEAGAMEIARRSRGTPRLANRLLKRVRDFAQVKYDGGPVGLDTLAASIGEDSGTIEDVYEPYLIQNGFLARTPRGRTVTEKTYQHFGLSPSK